MTLFVLLHCNSDVSFPILGYLNEKKFELCIRPWAYWGHEFDLSGSRDVIGHVTIR